MRKSPFVRANFVVFGARLIFPQFFDQFFDQQMFCDPHFYVSFGTDWYLNMTSEPKRPEWTEFLSTQLISGYRQESPRIPLRDVRK